MKTVDIIRCAFISVIAYFIWRTLTILTNDAWTIVLTVVVEIVFVGVLAYVLVRTNGGTHRDPSAVRDRIREQIQKQRDRFSEE